MPQRTGSSNPDLQKLIAELRSRGYKEKSGFMLAIANELAKPSRSRASVNISKLERTCNAKEDVIIPGKLLADGIISKHVTVACFSSSEEARKKIEKAGGKIVSIEHLVEKNPKGTGVRIMC